MSHAPILTRIAFIILIASAATPAHAMRDPIGYPDGMNTYAGYHILHGSVDPMGLEFVQKSWTRDDYYRQMWKPRHKQYLPKIDSAASIRAFEKIEDLFREQLDRGCVGVTCVNLGDLTLDPRRPWPDMSNCYKTLPEAQQAQSQLTCPQGECAELYSIHYWPGGTEGQSFVADPNTGKVDMSQWTGGNFKPMPGGGSGVNFDFGYYDPRTGHIWHADMYHNPDRDGDGEGDRYPFADIREMEVLESSIDKWQEGYNDFMENGVLGEVWCTACTRWRGRPRGSSNKP